MNDVALSVVLATTSSALVLDDVLSALDVACAGVSAEVIVVSERDAPYDTAASSRVWTFSLRHEHCRSAALTPVRWGIGASTARGRVVAFTTDQMRVHEGWGLSLCESIAADTVGAGGPIALNRDVDQSTAATYLIRFSAFLPDGRTTPGAVADIAGDNGAYSRAAIGQHSDLLREGFWEIEFHRRFSADGKILKMLPRAVATFVGPVQLPALIRQRFEHASEFGRARVVRHGESKLRIICLAPMVPLVLLRRIHKRSRANALAADQFWRCLPQLLALSVSWALGEAVGAARSRPKT